MTGKQRSKQQSKPQYASPQSAQSKMVIAEDDCPTPQTSQRGEEFRDYSFQKEEPILRRRKTKLALGGILVLSLVVVAIVLGVVLSKNGGDGGDEGSDVVKQGVDSSGKTVVSARFTQRLETNTGEILTKEEQKAFCRVIENNAVMAVEGSDNVEGVDAICEVLEQTLIGLGRHRGLRNSRSKRELVAGIVDVLYSLEYQFDPPADGVGTDSNDAAPLMDMFVKGMNQNLVKVTNELNNAGLSVEKISVAEKVASDKSEPVASTATEPPLTASSTKAPTENNVENTIPPAETPVEISDDTGGTAYELSDKTAMYRSAAAAPFPVQMTQFSSNVVEGYSSCSDLQDDILAAARIKANALIMQQAKGGFNGGIIGIPGLPEISIAASQQESTESIAEDTGDTAEDQKGTDDSDGFETNNQVKNVHEADVIKSNGEEIYIAYGDKVVVVDATSGTVLSETVMPKLETLGSCSYPKPPIVFSEPEEVEEETEEFNEVTVPNGKAIAFPNVGDNKPKVQSLLLHDDRLTVVVQSSRDWCYMENQPILSDYGRTQIRLYDVSNPAELVLIGTRNLQGTYREARRIEKHAHFVSVTNVNTWSIVSDLYRWKSHYIGLNDTEYIQKATEIATNSTADFAQRLFEEMQVKNLDCGRMARISMMETGNRTEDEDDVDSSYGDGIINGYAQVTTVDMQGDHTSDLESKENTLTAHVSGLFLRTPWVEVYASETMLVLFGTGYQWNFMSSTQTTYLCAFLLEDSTATPTAIGKVPGDLLNQFSMDHKDGHLRVASTEFGSWGWFNHTAEDGSETQVWRRETNNRITVLRFPDDSLENDAYNSSILEEVGHIDGLGEPGEQIFSVRYVEDMAYVVTFLQTDPFYVIDMTDPEKPTRVGELKISGFSNYLHSVDDDTLLAVGQEANDDGVATGLQVSMFDVSNASDPSLITRYTVEDDDSTRSWSAAQFEHKAFRYLSKEQMLILPAKISGDDDFDGFLVFGVNKTNIEPEFSITHSSSYGGCHYNARLQPRSIVVSGQVTTFKGHTIQNHDLTSRDKIWGIELDENITKGDCWWD